MGALNQLDSDRARLSSGHHQAIRDIVQFIRKLSQNLILNYAMMVQGADVHGQIWSFETGSSPG
jgi:hypothetical protein